MRCLLFVLVACSSSSANAPALPHRTGDVHDFDYFAGGWTTKQHRLSQDGTWEDFPATLCMQPYLGGMITVDELVFPTKGWAGLTVRTFDKAAKQWSIYWVSSKDGVMGTPVVGGFAGSVGEFFGIENGELVRYKWNKADANTARWEQAISKDGKAWKTNWTADFLRADPAAVCENGRPRT